MLAERLERYFGATDTETADYISKMESSYDERGLEDIYQWVIKNRGKRYGFPDISFLSKAFSAFKPKMANTYYWAICAECGGGYWNNLPYCPRCWDRGYLCSARSIHVSGEKPSANVIRYNKSYTKGVGSSGAESEGICYDCKSREQSFCAWFGVTEYECKEFRECACSRCCTRARRFNAQAVAERNISYAVPFRNVKVI